MSDKMGMTRRSGTYTKSPSATSTATITRPDNTTAYTANDVVGESPASVIEFDTTMYEDAQHFYIVGARLIYNVSAVISGMSTFRLHLWNESPTAIADNSAFTIVSADKDSYLGYIDFATPTDVGDFLISIEDGINIKRKLADEDNKIYGQLQTIGGFTPSAEDVIDITIETVGA